MIDGKQLARRIFQRTIDALNVGESLSRCLACADGKLICGGRQYELKNFSDFRIIALGKAAHGMLSGLLAILPSGIRFRAIVSAPTSPHAPHPQAQYFVGGHPTPNEQSLLAAKAALELLKNCSDQTLVLVLLSGGGSALMELPLPSAVSLEDVQKLNRVLVTCGASIEEINTVRKHVSAVKGGRLAAVAAPATVLTLAISDVPFGKESALASGPTLPDPTTCADAVRILEKYKLRTQIPVALAKCIDDGHMPETPKRAHRAFERSQFELVLGMHELFHTAHRIAESQDCMAFCDNSTDDWPVQEAAESLLAQLADLRCANPRQAVALIADGELSSTVTGDGLGGRNSAFVLSCVEQIAGKGIAVLSAGTDGIDGNSPAAGAVADGQTLARSQSAGLDWKVSLRQSDSFRFFDSLGDAVVTGPTGNNLRDIRLLIALPAFGSVT